MQDSAFLENYFIPFLNNYNDLGVNFIVHDLEGKIRFLNEQTAKIIANTEAKQLIGTTLFDLKIISESEYETLKKIRNEVITKRQIIRCINFSTNCLIEQGLSHHIYQCSVLPIIDLNNEVIGTLTTGRLLDNLNPYYHYIKGLNIDLSTETSKTLNLLSPRELEIVYLLAHGMSQRDVASFLGISRGNVSRVLTENISKKWDVEPTTDAIIEKALHCGISTHVPKSLAKHQIIILP
ncbi:PAS domain-containing protein [Cysteiniphilum sp. JM-1]|uniref:PAS domain-containing protein n=1 Tax=Cysteiniphilum sp. JM-1 TaxID=2610891 RepID=UPI001243A508|nr:PAS domain-containing protein [Cysteiniphilum sp. JM-1]